MISKLTGILDSAHDNFVILDVNGVGYQVFCSNTTLSRCGQQGDPLSLLIDTNVREDAITLYGFMSASEQEWFRLLTSVQGVGAKAGMAILALCPPEQLGFAIASGDKAAIQRADGVGPKLAARILTELKDKAAKIDLSAKPKGVSMPAAANEAAPSGVEQDAVSALINLGYQRSDAYAAVMQVKQKAENDNLEVGDMIRLALQELSV
ncbi:MAG: Holliday junction branch migration protein RuvA [Alphaproteobacteria bacterium]|nr:Holliday junction branch migration protein RuvA [Alphaproteobacteria bacterium]